MTTTHPTRHLIVTLPDTSGDEADAAIGAIGNAAHAAVYGDRDPGMTVSHALGQTVLAGGLPGTRLRREAPGGRDRVFLLDGTGDVTHALDADEARQLAGALLTLAHDISPA